MSEETPTLYEVLTSQKEYEEQERTELFQSSLLDLTSSRSTSKSTSKSTSNSVCPCSLNNIRQIPSTGLVISNPGIYCFKNDIVFEPSTNPGFAILIDSSNVTIDLKGHCLSQVDNGFLGFAVAFANSNLENIKIINGTIKDFSVAAIYGQFSGGNKIETLCISDLILTNNGSQDLSSGSAIYLVDVTGVSGTPSPTPPISKNVLIKDCKIVRNLGRSAVFLFRVDGIQILNSNVDDQSRSLGTSSCFGAIIQQSDNIVLKCSTFNGTTLRNNASPSPQFGPQLGGLDLEFCQHVLVDQCQFNKSKFEPTASFRFVFLANGANLSNTRDAIFVDCQFNEVDGANQSTVVNGVHMSDAAGQTFDTNRVVFKRCQFNENKGSFPFPVGGLGSSAGMNLITLKNVLFDDCDFSNNEGDRLGYGLFLGSLQFQVGNTEFTDVRNITLKNCSASDNQGGSGDAAGFYIYSGPDFDNLSFTQNLSTKNIVLEGCVANNNTSTDSFAAGIRLERARDGAFNSSIRNVVVKDCTTLDNIGGVTGDSAGILIAGVQEGEVSNNVSNNNQNGILLYEGSGLVIIPGFGSLPFSYTTNNILVKENCVSNNSEVGIKDNKATSTSAFVRNTAYNNGNGANYEVTGGVFSNNEDF